MSGFSCTITCDPDKWAAMSEAERIAWRAEKQALVDSLYEPPAKLASSALADEDQIEVIDNIEHYKEPNTL